MRKSGRWQPCTIKVISACNIEFGIVSCDSLRGRSETSRPCVLLKQEIVADASLPSATTRFRRPGIDHCRCMRMRKKFASVRDLDVGSEAGANALCTSGTDRGVPCGSR